MSTQPNQNQPTKDQPAEQSRPNEHGTVSVQGFVKIWDPVAATVFVEKRA
jgi:hypothetical protein